MPDRLPSLTALRTFEAAARHLSFSKAAVELSVTPAAVGFQIKRLEEDLGAPLFVRKHRAVELTQTGQTLARELQPAFDTIASVWRSVDKSKPGPALKITASEHQVREWLLPAAKAAEAENPGPELSWDVSRKKRDLDTEKWDVAIRYALKPDERYFCEPIQRPCFLPLARPEVARLIRRPGDLMEHGLINVEFGLDTPDGYTAWPSFLRLLGLPTDPIFAMTCLDSLTATEMAADTSLVAIGFPAEKHLKTGRLAYPFKKAILPKSRNWFICANGRENTDEILWLRNAFHKGTQRWLQSIKDVQLYELDGSPAKTLV